MTNSKGEYQKRMKDFEVLHCFIMRRNVTFIDVNSLSWKFPVSWLQKAGRRRASKHSHSLLFFAHTQTQHFDILTSTTSPKEIMPGNYWKLKYRNPLISLLLKNIFFNHLRFFVISLFASSWLIKWINQLYLNFLELHNYFLFF